MAIRGKIAALDEQFSARHAENEASITVALSIEDAPAVRWPDALVAIATMR